MSPQNESFATASPPTNDEKRKNPRPWGLSRMASFPATEPAHALCQVEIDPVTQIARYLDEHGQVIEMGKHGTPDRQFATRTEPAGPDGGGGKPPGPGGDPDTVTDYESE